MPGAGATAPATSKKEGSSSEELVADEPARGLRSATQVLRQFKAVTHVSPPDATLAAPSGFRVEGLGCLGFRGLVV